MKKTPHPYCPYCTNIEQTITHLFFTCSVAGIKRVVRPICWAIILRFFKGLGLQGNGTDIWITNYLPKTAEATQSQPSPYALSFSLEGARSTRKSLGTFGDVVTTFRAKSVNLLFPGSSLFLPRGRKREDPGNEVANR